MSTIFSKIINGEIFSYKIWEDEHTYAFLDISPLQFGHTLIVPKIEVDYFVDVPEPYYTAVFQAAKKLAPAIENAVSCQRVGLMVQGVDVPHFHLHLIPILENQPFLASPKAITSEEMSSIQTKILANLIY